MSYVERILQPGEKRMHSSRIHWIVYVPGLLTALVAIGCVVAARTLAEKAGAGEATWLAFGGVIGLIALILLLREWFVQWTTEIEITDRRIIHKRGFIRRRTAEMNMDKVESVDVDQSILGRILDYGDVQIKGVGIGMERIATISAPLDFRNHVTAR